MDFFEYIEIGTIVKFAILFIPLAAYIFYVADTLYWKLMLTLGAFIGIGIAIGGKTLGGDHGFGGRR